MADTCGEREDRPIQTRVGAWPDRPNKKQRFKYHLSSSVICLLSARTGLVQYRQIKADIGRRRTILLQDETLITHVTCPTCQHVSRAGPASRAGHVRETRVS